MVYFYLNLLRKGISISFISLLLLAFANPYTSNAQIGFVGDLRAQANNNGPFTGTGTAMEFGSLKVQVEVFKSGWTGNNFSNNGNNIDCKLILRKTSTNLDPDYEATSCTANPWLNASYGEEASSTNSFGGGGISMNFIGYNTNNDIYELDLQNIPPGRYSYECRCDDYTDNSSFLSSWNYADCGDEDGDGLADGDLHYLTVGHEGVFRQILVAKTSQSGVNKVNYFFNESFQPGNPSIEEWEVLDNQSSTLCEFLVGYEINTYKNVSVTGDITGANLVWSVTAKTANDVNETTSIIDFRDNCDGLQTNFSGGGSCQGDGTGNGIGNGTDLIQDQRWQISPDNPASLARYPNSGGFIDIKAAIMKANGNTFPLGTYTFTFRADVVGSLGLISGNTQSKTFEVVTGTCTPLPIELTNFDAEKVNRTVELNWTTETEIDNDYFELERSTDSRQFTSIKTIAGAGNSSTSIHYYYIDEQPFAGINYYRLKQIDFDGQFSYSEIISVDMTRSTKFISGVYPNPVDEELTILFETDDQEAFEVTYDLFSVSGKRLKQGIISSNAPKLDCSDLGKGVYFLKMNKVIDGNTYHSTIKLIH